MNLQLNRIFKGPEYTIGRLCVDGDYFCDTLEDAVREMGFKIPGKTAVPAGTYKVILNYSPRFKRILPLLIDVPNFEGVRIHPGNTAEDTQGCLLVGFNRLKGVVLDSRATFGRLLKKMLVVAESGENIEIEIKNESGQISWN